MPGSGESSGSKTGGRAHFATPEQETGRWQAAQRLAELIEVREALVPDRDDSTVLPELVGVEGEMKAAEAIIKAFD